MQIVTRQNSSPDSTEIVSFKPQPGLGAGYDPNDVVSQPFYVQGQTSLFEAMTPNSGGGTDRWKSFQHYKMQKIEPNDRSVSVRHPTVQFTPYGGFVGQWYHLGEHSDRMFGMRGFGTPGIPNEGLSGMYVPDMAEGFIPDPPDLDNLVQRALARMLPDIRNELSVVNSVIELKDVVSVRSTIRNLSRLPEALRGIRVGQKLREFLRVGSDLYLQKKFNIDPLLSDISGVFTAVAGLEKQLNALLTRSAKAQRRHFFMPLHEDNDTVETYGPYTLSGLSNPQVYPNVAGIHKSFRQVASEPSKFHMMIEYNFNYTQYQLEHARVLALLDRFGLNLNPQIIWNAIPWSFVVDWVLGVGRWLDQFAIANMAPKINIRRCLWSITRSRRINIQYNIGANSFGFASSPTVGCGTFIETSYKRVVGMPSRSSFITSGLSSTEFSLGAALVLSRGRRRRNRKR